MLPWRRNPVTRAKLSSPGHPVTRTFPIKRLADGRALINLGCGSRMHREWNNVDFSYYARLAGRPRLSAFLRAAAVLSSARYERLLAADPAIIAWDLRKGVPFPDASFDVVYHSHVLEHLQRRDAQTFLRECGRVLKPRGVLRIVVPDLETLARAYLETLPSASTLSSGEAVVTSSPAHEHAIERLLEQMVREEPFGASEQAPLLRRLERLIRGDARSAGEVHRWMYDRYTLASALQRAGFQDVAVCSAVTSGVRDWGCFGLDVNADGSDYIAGSLYVEAVR
jgi:SAM-dependent methyltransferase